MQEPAYPSHAQTFPEPIRHDAGSDVEDLAHDLKHVLIPLPVLSHDMVGHPVEDLIERKGSQHEIVDVTESRYEVRDQVYRRRKICAEHYQDRFGPGRDTPISHQPKDELEKTRRKQRVLLQTRFVGGLRSVDPGVIALDAHSETPPLVGTRASWKASAAAPRTATSRPSVLTSNLIGLRRCALVMPAS